MNSLFDTAVQLLIAFIDKIGYLGIFLGMFLESTVVPIPSELIMIPAGISAANGGFNIYLAVILGILGNVCGAIFSYYLAAIIGRTILFYIGKYFFVKAETIIKIESFFKNHGPISILIGRLLPGFRHFISLFAGIAKMDIKYFILYTVIGSSIWTSVLAFLGYLIGENQDAIKEYLHAIIIICAVVCILVLTVYFWIKKRKITGLAINADSRCP